MVSRVDTAGHLRGAGRCGGLRWSPCQTILVLSHFVTDVHPDEECNREKVRKYIWFRTDLSMPVEDISPTQNNNVYHYHWDSSWTATTYNATVAVSFRLESEVYFSMKRHIIRSIASSKRHIFCYSANILLLNIYNAYIFLELTEIFCPERQQYQQGASFCNHCTFQSSQCCWCLCCPLPRHR